MSLEQIEAELAKEQQALDQLNTENDKLIDEINQLVEKTVRIIIFTFFTHQFHGWSTLDSCPKVIFEDRVSYRISFCSESFVV